MAKVRVNSLYTYNPVMLDVLDGRTGLKTGDVVRVINQHGCPPANTMGHCYVGDKTTGRFIGMVCCNSLTPYKPVSKAALARQNRLIRDLTTRLTTCTLSDVAEVKSELTKARTKLAEMENQ